MKMRILTIIACFCPLITQAQTFTVDTVFKNGPLAERINLVFMGDGYQVAELTKFKTDVSEILTELFNQSPFKEYKNYFNAFAINVISNQSGATHPKTSVDADCVPVPAFTADTYFGSTFDAGNIHRLLVPTKTTAISSVLASHLPQFDQVFIVVNSAYYGGSGGFYATGSTHLNGKQVAIHEIGHSFALLADEYWAGPQYASEKANMTQQTNSSLVKWNPWLSVDGIGIYAHQESPTWQRPHQNCKMRYLSAPFCKVCTEAFVERIHSLVHPLRDYTPTESVMPVPANGSIQFSLDVIRPISNTLRITWQRGNATIARNQESISLDAASFGNGALIRAIVMDTTQLVRSALHQTNHMYVVEWEVGEIEDDITAVPVKVEKREIIASVFPNPAVDELNISYFLDRPTDVTITLLDASGKKHKTILKEKQPEGEHRLQLDAKMLMKTPGEYLLKFDFDNAVLVRKLIKL